MIQLKLTKTMKTSYIFGITILVLMVVAGALIVSAFNQPTVSAQDLSAAAMRVQVTSTPAQDDNSVIGSTDGIVVMGVVIVIIIITPLIFRRKRK